MGEFVCLALGILELCVALAALALAFYIFTQAYDSLWITHTDKINFYLWLENKNKDN